MNELIDLHTHSTASDGILSPEKLIDHAINRKVTTLALTDHDTVEGLATALKYAEKRNFNLVPGIEFSVKYSGGTFHLVGLFIDHNNTDLLVQTKKLSELRDRRIYRMIDDLKKNNITIPVEEVQAESDGGTIGRPHIARVLVKHGYADTVNNVFKKYLIKGKPGYVSKERIGLSEAIGLIKSAGGLALIAHPISLEFKDFSDFEIILKDFISKGGDGIEVFCAMHTAEQVREFNKIAVRYDLLISGGSDYHGDKGETIGYYGENTAIPLEIYDKIRNASSPEK